jgi:hypothetical protein
MGDIDILAQESTSFEDFLSKVSQDPDLKMADVNDSEVKAFLQDMWNDVVERGDTSGGTMQESIMSDIDIVAQESATFQEFLGNIKADSTYKSLDVNDREVMDFLLMMYNDSKGISEAKRVRKLSIKEEIRRAVRAMLKEVDNTNDRVAYKDKNNPNFIYIDIKYTAGMGGFLTALGSTTMSGSARKKGQERAMLIAKDTANELEKSYQLDDIDIQDLENGKVQIFAVSDDFTNIDPKTDSKLKSIVDKYQHNL